jgi:hypothetical protein
MGKHRWFSALNVYIETINASAAALALLTPINVSRFSRTECAYKRVSWLNIIFAVFKLIKFLKMGQGMDIL